MNLEGSRQQLDRFGKMFWTLTRFILEAKAEFDDEALAFHLRRPPIAGAKPGTYHLISKTQPNVTGEFLYRLSHPLGEHVVQAGKDSPTPMAAVAFDITRHPARIAMVEELKGRSGWLHLQ